MGNNQAYMRFQFALGIIEDCYDALINDEVSSHSELRARDEFIKVCIAIVNEFGDVPLDE